MYWAEKLSPGDPEGMYTRIVEEFTILEYYEKILAWTKLQDKKEAARKAARG